MLSLIEKLKPRLKEAKTLENSLKKMQDSYTKITKELEKLSSAMLVSPYSSITYTSVYQRKISNLVLSAKYMTQTVVLRLSTLSIYIKEISDILEIIRNLNAINSVDRTIAEKTGSWFSRRILKQ
jgi:predicted transcriptional regulator